MTRPRLTMEPQRAFYNEPKLAQYHPGMTAADGLSRYPDDWAGAPATHLRLPGQCDPNVVWVPVRYDHLNQYKEDHVTQLWLVDDMIKSRVDVEQEDQPSMVAEVWVESRDSMKSNMIDMYFDVYGEETTLSLLADRYPTRPSTFHSLQAYVRHQAIESDQQFNHVMHALTFHTESSTPRRVVCHEQYVQRIRDHRTSCVAVHVLDTDAIGTDAHCRLLQQAEKVAGLDFVLFHVGAPWASQFAERPPIVESQDAQARTTRQQAMSQTLTQCMVSWWGHSCSLSVWSRCQGLWCPGGDPYHDDTARQRSTLCWCALRTLPGSVVQRNHAGLVWRVLDAALLLKNHSSLTLLRESVNAFVVNTTDLQRQQQSISNAEHEQWSTDNSEKWMRNYQAMMKGRESLLANLHLILASCADFEPREDREINHYDGRLWMSRAEWLQQPHHNQWYSLRQYFIGRFDLLVRDIDDFTNAVLDLRAESGGRWEDLARLIKPHGNLHVRWHILVNSFLQRMKLYDGAVLRFQLIGMMRGAVNPTSPTAPPTATPFDSLAARGAAGPYAVVWRGAC